MRYVDENCTRELSKTWTPGKVIKKIPKARKPKDSCTSLVLYSHHKNWTRTPFKPNETNVKFIFKVQMMR